MKTREVALTSQEQLQLQQLLQARFWEENKENQKSKPVEVVLQGHPNDWTPGIKWVLTQGIVLHEWQQRCIDAWFQNSGRGIIKVVTGAGKTILALGVIEKLQQTQREDLRVAIVVPTIVLLEQWYEEILRRGNLPLNAIGRMGGGRESAFNDRTRILICVLNSAAKKLPQMVERAGISDKLLLVVDECHRAGASERQGIFLTERKYSLGLSATPERDDDPDGDVALNEVDYGPKRLEDTVVGRELGNVIFEMTYADAIRCGVLPPFKIIHYGISLRDKEKTEYEHISQAIKDLRSELETPNRRGLALIRWCRSKAAAQNPKAAQFVALTTKRKRLLYRVDERSSAVLKILEKAFKNNPGTKAILFHESIEEVMSLFALLREKGFSVVAEHSEFPDSMRAESIRLFRNDVAAVIVSARSLIEGFNVPAADIGIIVAASASVRQRVQTLGRLLRRRVWEDGSEKHATLYVLYARNTVDELIYEKADWEKFVGAERNEYFIWDDVEHLEPMPSDAAPRSHVPNEIDVPIEKLRPGELYPGNPDEGFLFTRDTQGNIRDEAGTLVKPHPELQGILSTYQKEGGRFRVTPVNRFVTKLHKAPNGWESLYLGRLDRPVELVDSLKGNEGSSVEYKPGDIYPIGMVKGRTFSVLQRDRRLIAKKIGGKVCFVVPAESLHDSEKRMALLQIQKYIAEVYAKGRRINKITVTNEGHVVYLFNGEAYFIGNAPEEEKGFIFESIDKGEETCQ